MAEDAQAESGSLGRPRSLGFSFSESCKPAAASGQLQQLRRLRYFTLTHNRLKTTTIIAAITV